MAKSYKSPAETTSKHRICLKCFHCKIITFRSLSKLKKWCLKNEQHLSYAWEKKFNAEGEVTLYRCIKHRTRARIFRICDNPFILNCEFFDGGE